MSQHTPTPFLLFSCCVFLLLTAATTSVTASSTGGNEEGFSIENDRFYVDGSPFQIISGAIHYFRIHPDLWRDRLVRCAALGLNTIEIYVPWNYHEPRPGKFNWSGSRDVATFISIADELGLKVLLRAGPYICAEWDFGGLPAWLQSSAVSGGGSMKLRSSDPLYLAHVDRWWRALLPQMKPFMRTSPNSNSNLNLKSGGGGGSDTNINTNTNTSTKTNGSPILMVQIENEFGLCNGGNDTVYLQHLAALAKEILGDETVLFTTDPAHAAAGGTLPGDAVFTAVDFGPGWFYPDDYFSTQRALNPPGKSPPFNSEFYSGWLTHWGEAMANTSAVDLVRDTEILLRYGASGGGASLNFYMAHGGTNFGFWSGANVEVDGRYEPHITSYDYDAVISEAGGYCQPGISGAGDGCKYALVRQTIQNYLLLLSESEGGTPLLPDVPPEPSITAYGRVELQCVGSLLDAAPAAPIVSQLPLEMEEYGQQQGIIMYRTLLDFNNTSGNGIDGDDDVVLSFVVPPNDFTTVLLNGQLQGQLKRGGTANMTLFEGGKRKRWLENGVLTETREPPLRFDGEQRSDSGSSVHSSSSTLDIIVEAMGRKNFGCEEGGWDKKGLQSTDVRVNGKPITHPWEVFNFDFEDLDMIPKQPPPSATAPTTSSSSSFGGPMFYRGTLRIEGSAAEEVTDAGDGVHLADTFLDSSGLGKGIAWVNGFNLGWYWPTKGPQMTLYVPGPVLKPGDNDVLILEVEKIGKDGDDFTVSFVDEPNFWGPASGGGDLGEHRRRGPAHTVDHSMVLRRSGGLPAPMVSDV